MTTAGFLSIGLAAGVAVGLGAEGFSFVGICVIVSFFLTGTRPVFTTGAFTGGVFATGAFTAGFAGAFATGLTGTFGAGLAGAAFLATGTAFLVMGAAFFTGAAFLGGAAFFNRCFLGW